MPVSDRLRIATLEEAPALARLINEAFRVESFFKAGDRTSAAGIVHLMEEVEFLVLDGEDGAPTVTV